MTKHLHIACAVLIAFLLGGCAGRPPKPMHMSVAPAVTPHYSLTLINFPAVGINDRGEMFGSIGGGRPNPHSLKPDWPTVHLAVWRNGKMTDVGSLPDADYCQPCAINNAGEVTGIVYDYSPRPGDTSPNEVRLFLWSKGKMLELGSFGEAVGLNDQGQVVGQKMWPDGQHGFMYTHGKMLEIKNPLSPRYSTINAINGKGQMVGVASGSSGPPSGPPNRADIHALFWDKGRVSEMHLPQQSRFSLYGGPVAINEMGQIVLNADDLDEPGAENGVGVLSRCYVWQNGIATEIGPMPGFSLSGAAINSQGQIIGNATKTGLYPQTNITHPFLWQSGAIYDLNDLTSHNGWMLKRVSGLNNKGQIVGYGEGGGRGYNFLLTPITK